MLVLGFGRLLAQSDHSGATNLLREIDASQGARSKATPVRTLDSKLSGVMLEITAGQTAKSRPLTSEEQEHVRALSQQVLGRCTNAS